MNKIIYIKWILTEFRLLLGLLAVSTTLSFAILFIEKVQNYYDLMLSDKIAAISVIWTFLVGLPSFVKFFSTKEFMNISVEFKPLGKESSIKKSWFQDRIITLDSSKQELYIHLEATLVEGRSLDELEFFLEFETEPEFSVMLFGEPATHPLSPKYLFYYTVYLTDQNNVKGPILREGFNYRSERDPEGRIPLSISRKGNTNEVNDNAEFYILSHGKKIYSEVLRFKIEKLISIEN